MEGPFGPGLDFSVSLVYSMSYNLCEKHTKLIYINLIDMGLPSKRRTRTSKRQRASHFGLKKTNLRRCDNCKTPSIPHQACEKCGTYRGRTVQDTKKRVERSLRNKPRTRGKTNES